MAAGLTGWISVRWNILLLARYGTALYSINLRIMGRPNIALLGTNDFHSPRKSNLTRKLFISSSLNMIPAAMCIIATVVLVIVYRFLSSEKGLAMRVMGANPRMAKAQGIAPNRQVLLGIAISNGLVALAGALWSTKSRFCRCHDGCWNHSCWFSSCYCWRGIF